jgi:hypothetical protein
MTVYNYAGLALKGRARAMQRGGREPPAAATRHITESAMSRESQDMVKFKKHAGCWVARSEGSSAGLSAIFQEASAERTLVRRLVKLYVTNDISRHGCARRYGRCSSRS